MRAPIWFGLSLIALSRCTPAQANKLSPCERYPTRTGWHVFVDHQDRFCFEYPAKYHVAPAVFAPGVSTGRPGTRFIVRLTTKPSPAGDAIAGDPTVATIAIFAHEMPFRPGDLTSFAPTGLEDTPPRHVHAAHGDFYYYGPGGGGVDYPDTFLFGLRGRTFSIDFVGPYSTGKTPEPETKRIEPEVLASFHSF